MPFHYDRENSLGYQAAMVSRRLTGLLGRRFAEAGLELTPEQWSALVLLWNRDGLTQQDLAEGLCLEKSSVSRLVDGLEKRGYVYREQDPLDARLRRLMVSGKGMALRDESVRIARGVLTVAFQGVTQAEQALCTDVLKRVLANLA